MPDGLARGGYGKLRVLAVADGPEATAFLNSSSERFPDMHQTRNQTLAAGSLMLACALVPLMNMVSYRGASVAFYLLLAASLWVIWGYRAGLTQAQPYRGLLLAYCLPLVATLWSLAGNGVWSGSSVEVGVRIALGALLLVMAFQQVPLAWLKHGLWGVYAAGWGSAAVIVSYALKDYPVIQRPPDIFLVMVAYGNLMLLWAVLTLMSLKVRLTTRPGLETAFKWLTGAVTLCGFLLTQTRSGWVAIPVFLLLGLWMQDMLRRPWKAMAWFFGALALVAAIGAVSPQLRDRALLIEREVVECTSVNPVAETSICIRFQLWRAAWHMFAENPLFGIGDGSDFSRIMQERYVQQGLVSTFTAENFGESHNEYMQALASHGVPGLLALLALYLAPLPWVAACLRRSLSPQARMAAVMAGAVCLGFAIFGLTELMFRNMRVMGLYIALVAWLVVWSHRAADAADRQAAIPTTAQ